MRIRVNIFYQSTLQRPWDWEIMNNTVGWSVLALFWLFSKTVTMLPIWYIFTSPIPKIGEFGRACAACANAAKFSFSKNYRDLQKDVFFWKFANTFQFILRTISKKEIKNLNKMYTLFGPPKWGSWFIIFLYYTVHNTKWNTFLFWLSLNF